jgi:hypothetical protein
VDRKAGSIQISDWGSDRTKTFLISEMVIPGSCSWNVGVGREKGEVENDEEGFRTMRVLGENIACFLKSWDSS